MQQFTHFRRTPGIAVAAILALMIVTATSCYYDYGLSYSDYDVVATAYSPSANFGAYKTFFMPDTIPHLTDETSDLIGHTNDQQILNAIANSFEAVGYQRVDTTAAEPDFVVTVEAVASKTVVIYGGGYWGWYPWYPGWGWGWGGYYPGYPPISGGYSYSNGTILVNMIDPDIAGPDNNVASIWFGAVNGLLGDTQAGVQKRLNSSINQLFNQSPYLGTTQP